ncbi:hypothetical protein SDC9_162281 [bioreactor metagenome]|uniref:Uncharacterized protein n=1 Tax=bioreactor metagenome TaxID=1076179 RepID=A0A645FN03_9ZZZZ
MRVDRPDILHPRSLYGHEVVVHLNDLLADDAAVVLTQQIIDLKYPPGGRILYRQHAAVRLAADDGGDNVAKELEAGFADLLSGEIAAQRLVAV